MKTLSILSLVLILTACQNTHQEQDKKTAAYIAKIQQQNPQVTTEKSFDFENYESGKLPADWSQYATGRDQHTEWQITNDQGNKVLAQLSNKHPNYHFNVVVYNGLTAKNIDLSVRFKAIKGQMDQGGGFVWRFKDADNYYVVRANPLEDNVVLYKVVNGKRSDLPLVGKGRTYGIDVPKLGNRWNNLRLVAKDRLFTVYLNGKKLFDVVDDTFTGTGKTGLWTKADAVTYFDDYKIKVLK